MCRFKKYEEVNLDVKINNKLYIDIVEKLYKRARARARARAREREREGQRERGERRRKKERAGKRKSSVFLELQFQVANNTSDEQLE